MLVLELGNIPRYRIETDCYRIIWNKDKFWIKKYSYDKKIYTGNVYNLTVKDNHTVCVGINKKFNLLSKQYFISKVIIFNRRNKKFKLAKLLKFYV